MKPYPKYSDFKIDDVIYGVTAPHVGCGIYTYDRKWSWPDRECTTKKEYDSWVKHLTDNGYEIPKEYLNAYVD